MSKVRLLVYCCVVLSLSSVAYANIGQLGSATTGFIGLRTMSGGLGLGSGPVSQHCGFVGPSIFFFPGSNCFPQPNPCLDICPEPNPCTDPEPNPCTDPCPRPKPCPGPRPKPNPGTGCQYSPPEVDRTPPQSPVDAPCPPPSTFPGCITIPG